MFQQGHEIWQNRIAPEFNTTAGQKKYGEWLEGIGNESDYTAAEQRAYQSASGRSFGYYGASVSIRRTVECQQLSNTDYGLISPSTLSRRWISMAKKRSGKRSEGDD
ncbi:MAG: hypothetical protein NUW37_07450 [Planctomycetes bacterium]|nr:hypothetical protein [Planctomycetota bacterium]